MPEYLPYLDPAHFMDNLSLDQAKTLFRRSVKFIEIECFSFCNRQCWHCPNSFIDRRSENIRMPETMYEQVINDLASLQWGYVGEIAYSRYNEPLSDRVILDRARFARNRLPHATLRIHTNGDYLTRQYLEELGDAGIRRLYIQTYLNSHNRKLRWTEKKANQHCERITKRIGVPVDYKWGKKGVSKTWEGRFRQMEVWVECRDFEKVGNDRGQVIQIGESPIRTSPCFSPFHAIYIDYNGCVMPCCNLRSDVPQHQDAVLYKITDQPGEIFKAYTCQKAVAWRKSLANFDPKIGVCQTCNKDVRDRTEVLEQNLARIKI